LSKRTELDHVIEEIVPIMGDLKDGELDLDAAELRSNYPAPMKKLIEVFGPVAEENKLHIHILERPRFEPEDIPPYDSVRFTRISVPPDPETYHITWHKRGETCGRTH